MVRAGKVLFATVRPEIVKEESITTSVCVTAREEPMPDSVQD